MNRERLRKLEILVVEDNPLHQEAAAVLLADHNLDIVENLIDAADRISPQLALTGRNSGASHTEYDAVLTALELPKGGEEKSEEVQYHGYTVALMAIKEGTPYVAIVAEKDMIGTNEPMELFKAWNHEGRSRYPIMELGKSRLGLYDIPGGDVTAMKTPDGRILPYHELDVDVTDCEYTKDWREALDTMFGTYPMNSSNYRSVGDLSWYGRDIVNGRRRKIQNRLRMHGKSKGGGK